MKVKLRAFLATLVAVVCAVTVTVDVSAQEVDLRFTTTINVGAGTDGLYDQLEVVVEADTDVDFDIGSSNFRFTYNADALLIPSGVSSGNQALESGTDYEFLSPFTSANFYFGNSAGTGSELSRISSTLGLAVGAPTGQTLEAAAGWVPIIRFFFDIEEDSQTEMLQWIAAPDPNPTQILLDDNVTQVPLDQFINSDLPLDAPAGVELAGFTSTVNQGAVSLNWTTASESGSNGFSIEVAPVSTDEWQEVGYVSGAGNSDAVRHYSYDITGLDYGEYRVRLKHVGTNGDSSYSPEIDVAITLSESFAMSDPYPSPFSTTARFELAVATAQTVTVDAYNLLGQKVLTIFVGEIPANQTRTFVVDGSSLSNGIYLIRAQGESFATTTSVAMVR